MSTAQRTEYQRMVAALNGLSSDDRDEVYEVARIMGGVVNTHGLIGKMGLALLYAKLAAVESESANGCAL